MTTARMPGRRPDPFLEHRAAVEAEFSIPALMVMLASAIGAGLGFVVSLLTGPQL